MRCLFTQLGCPFCAQVAQAVVKINRRLGFGEKISIIDINSTDPRVRLIDEMAKMEKKKPIVPILVLDNKQVKKTFGLVENCRENMLIVHSLIDVEHYVSYLETYLDARL